MGGISVNVDLCTLVTNICIHVFGKKFVLYPCSITDYCKNDNKIA